ncbi:MAG TPA: EAL domain-containing protein [Bacillales bacterium]|nr:EAL domain-containing protein [Bacillales bacterium]
MWGRARKGNFNKKKAHETFRPVSPCDMPAMKSLVENFSEAACFYDFYGNALHVNDRFRELLGFGESEQAMLDAGLKQLFRHFRQDTVLDGQPQIYNDRIARKDGPCVPIRVTHIPLIVAGERLGSFCFLCPTQETDAPKLSAVVKGWFQEIVNRLEIAVGLVDMSDKKVTFVSDAIQKICEIPAEDIDFRTWCNIVHPDDLESVIARQSELREIGEVVHRYRILTPSGKLKWVKDHSLALKKETGEITAAVVTLEDITEQNLLENKLHTIAFIDELTQLQNNHSARKVLEEWMGEHAHNGETFAILRLNLDHFTKINDLFGHAVGDEMIKRIAKRMKDAVKENGIVFRLLGDDFCILARHRNRVESYEELAETILEAVGVVLPFRGYDFHLTACIGISLFPSDGKSSTRLMKNARTALKRAKQLGPGNALIYSRSMNIESFKSFELENDLRNAVKNRELYFEYQPKIEAKTQKAVGAEALIRWKHPTWGIVSPSEFMKIAEETTLIHQISDLVMESVCRQAGYWITKNVPFQFISFNLSAKDFLKRDLGKRIKRRLDKYGVPPERLEIEITEGAMLQTSETVEQQMKDLKALGVTIALDDFGVGYSSLSHLKRFPVDTIKIDRSFVDSVSGNEQDEKIVQSLIDLGIGLNKKVVTEGVETREQYELLKKMGCHVIQGFLFSKSVSPAAMEEIFREETVPLKKGAGKPPIERRRYSRIDLPLPLGVKMTMISLNNKSVSLGSTEVLVNNIGVGGLRLLSRLRLTAQADILYRFEVDFMNTAVKGVGKIVWAKEIQKDVFCYGVEFSMPEREKEHWSETLNRWKSRLGSNDILKEARFITEDPVAYLRTARTIMSEP